MQALRNRLIRHLGVAVACLLILGAFAGLVRLLPWLVAESVPFRVSLPFVRGLAAVTSETAWLVGFPIAAATGVAAATDAGERQALAALGVRPRQLLPMSAPIVVVASLAIIGLAMLWGDDARHPGRFAQRLVDQGRQACTRVAEPRALAVPMLKMTWICFPDRPPTIVGRVPGQRDAWLSAHRLDFDDRVSSLRAEGLVVVVPKRDAAPAISASAGVATIVGLPALGSGSTVHSLPRAAVLAGGAAAAFWIALVGTWVLRVRHQLLALGLGAGGPVAALACLHALDRAGAGLGGYLLVPAAASATSAALYGAASMWLRSRLGVRRK